MIDWENLAKRDGMVGVVAGFGSTAQKKLGNVTNTVNGTVTGLVQTVRNKTTTLPPSEDHEICKSHSKNSLIHLHVNVLYLSLYK